MTSEAAPTDSSPPKGIALAALDRTPLRIVLGRVTALSLPVVFENLMQTATLLVDALMIAQLPNNGALLAAVAMVGIAYWRLTNVAGATQFGVGAYVARRWGEDDGEGAGKALAHGMVLGVVSGGILLAAMYFVAPFLFRMLQGGGTAVDPVAQEQATEYFRIVLLALPCRMAMINVAAAMRAAGDTRTPLAVTVMMVVLNVILNSMLIYGKWGAPAMGMRGAAISTAICFTAGAAVLLLVAWRGVAPARFSSMQDQRLPSSDLPTVIRGWGTSIAETMVVLVKGVRDRPLPRQSAPLHMDRRGLRLWLPGVTPKILRVSGPALGEQILASIGFLPYFAMVGSFGTAVLAAHSATVRVESMAYMAGYAITAATAALVGQAMGAGRLPLAWRLFRINTWLAIAMLGGAGLMFMVIPEALLWLFRLEPEVAEIGYGLLAIVGIEQVFIATTMTLAGGLRGAGYTKAPFLAELCGTVIVRLGLGVFLAWGLGLGFWGLYWATVADWATRTTVLLIAVLRGKWQTTEV
ncbi:MAG: MATE family efflux transporter [Sumerlaeia bacterium]